MQRALAELEKEGLLINERTNGRKITGDTSMIQAMREDLANAKLYQFKTELGRLGFNCEEQLAFITSRWDCCSAE